MRKTLFALLLLLSVLRLPAGAQTFYQHDTSVKVFAYGREQTLAWCGGFDNPEFSEADLNKDGLTDLVVYERDLGVTTLINTGMSGGFPRYVYAPHYALNFPPCFNYMLLRDYNCDGIADLIHRGSDGFSVYKGYYNAGNELCFTFYSDLGFTNDVHSHGYEAGYTNPGDIPGIADVDGDGDLDFISYYITGGYMYFLRNMRVEDHLPCDSIRIRLDDRCWGKVLQGSYRAHTLDHSCDNSGLLKPTKVTHPGNAICLFDWDMDGDYDYLDGNTSHNELSFLKNGKVETAHPVDSMIYQDSLWQTGGHRVSMRSWPAGFNIDVDADGKSDLLISPNSGTGSENYRCVWYFKNNSTTGVPDWQFQSDTFLVDRSIDMGSASYPMLFDYNKDGKPDLFAGSDGYVQASGQHLSRLSYYANTSTPGNASFTLQSADFMGMGAANFEGAAPAAGDIDNDGISDLIIGHTNGTLSYFKNMAASEAVTPDWQPVQLPLKDAGGADINVGAYAAPFIYDIDKDGKNDLIIGNMYGYVQYYRNVSSTPGTISLQLINKKLGKVRTDPANNLGNFCTPFIGKLDSTGTDYMLLGSNSGNLYQYTGFQGGDTTATYTLLDGHYSFIDSTYNRYNHPGMALGRYDNHRTAITVGDIDGSGSYAMIKGNVKGGLEFYKRKVYVAGINDVSKGAIVSLDPNPAQTSLNIHWKGSKAGDVRISILDMTGRVCVSAAMPAYREDAVVSFGDLPQGLYLCVLTDGEQRHCLKFTVVK